MQSKTNFDSHNFLCPILVFFSQNWPIIPLQYLPLPISFHNGQKGDDNGSLSTKFELRFIEISSEIPPLLLLEKLFPLNFHEQQKTREILCPVMTFFAFVIFHILKLKKKTFLS
jgi:hypothetical protein